MQKVYRSPRITSYIHKPSERSVALTPILTDNIEFPYILLLISGGHSQLLIVEELGKYSQLGTTLDDAVGEAFDKGAKFMGLGYPGGPELEKLALKGDENYFDLPKPLFGQNNCNFSFSGLKTALIRLSRTLEPVDKKTMQNIETHLIKKQLLIV